ncbi:MAG: preprotein translocase subunit SecG [Rickettsiales bacterium]|jgi:preprotein translocase subunit SecG
MENLQFFLLILQVVIALVMIILVLIQKSDGDSLGGIGGGGGGSGGLNSVMSSKSSANILTKITMVLAGLFMLNCLFLALISSKMNNSSELEIDKIINQQNQEDLPASDFPTPKEK